MDTKKWLILITGIILGIFICVFIDAYNTPNNTEECLLMNLKNSSDQMASALISQSCTNLYGPLQRRQALSL